MMALHLTSSSSWLVKYSNDSKTFSFIITCQRQRNNPCLNNARLNQTYQDKKHFIWRCPCNTIIIRNYVQVTLSRILNIQQVHVVN